LDDVRDNAQSKIILLLVGNKCDLEEERQVSTEEGQEFADRNNLLFMEASAKNGHNVEATFQLSAQVINANINNGQLDLHLDNIGIKPGNLYRAPIEESREKDFEQTKRLSFD